MAKRINFAVAMAKHKLQRFEELKSMERVFQFPYPLVHTEHGLKGAWRDKVFHNSNPLVLELGCGRGEYTVGLSRTYPDINFIGIDIKGARLWRGGKTINEEKILNAAFLRVHIEWLPEFFDAEEVNEIWITFPDPQPQMTRENRRLTNPKFLKIYRSILKTGGVLHLKTDSSGLFEYTLEQLAGEKGILELVTRDLYADRPDGFDLSIQTTYEQIFLAKGKKINYLQFRFS
jgi:tRNA (guanine-N7-)-methyltransferase